MPFGYPFRYLLFHRNEIYLNILHIFLNYKFELNFGESTMSSNFPLFFAVAIIILVFLPIFTLSGVEGIMFRPMGFAISFALAGSLLYALIVAPVIACTSESALFLPEN